MKKRRDEKGENIEIALRRKATPAPLPFSLFSISSTTAMLKNFETCFTKNKVIFRFKCNQQVVAKQIAFFLHKLLSNYIPFLFCCDNRDKKTFQVLQIFSFSLFVNTISTDIFGLNITYHRQIPTNCQLAICELRYHICDSVTTKCFVMKRFK